MTDEINIPAPDEECLFVHPETGDRCSRVGPHPSHVFGWGITSYRLSNEEWVDLRDRTISGNPSKVISEVIDAAKGAAARDAALERVESAADEDWMDQARSALISVASRKSELIPDDLWLTGLPKPREARALGPVMLWGVAQGIIENTGRVRNTGQVLRHAAPVTIWRSLIAGEQDPADPPNRLVNFD